MIFSEVHARGREDEHAQDLTVNGSDSSVNRSDLLTLIFIPYLTCVVYIFVFTFSYFIFSTTLFPFFSFLIYMFQSRAIEVWKRVVRSIHGYICICTRPLARPLARSPARSCRRHHAFDGGILRVGFFGMG